MKKKKNKTPIIIPNQRYGHYSYLKPGEVRDQEKLHDYYQKKNSLKNK